MTYTITPPTLRQTTPDCPSDLRDAWARVFAYAWSREEREFLRPLNKDPRQTITQVATTRGNQYPEQLVAACRTILEYVNDPNSEEGFLALPPLPDSFRQGHLGLSEEQLYTYAIQDGLYGVLRVC